MLIPPSIDMYRNCLCVSAEFRSLLRQKYLIFFTGESSLQRQSSIAVPQFCNYMNNPPVSSSERVYNTTSKNLHHQKRIFSVIFMLEILYKQRVSIRSVYSYLLQEVFPNVMKTRSSDITENRIAIVRLYTRLMHSKLAFHSMFLKL